MAPAIVTVPSIARHAAPAPTGIARLARQAVGVVKALIGRREVARLLELDDRMLKDIGLVRSDVVGALSARLAEDPSTVLRLRSVEQRRRQTLSLRPPAGRSPAGH